MALFAALFLTDLLAFWLIISGRGRWWLKFVTLVLICTLNFTVWHAFRYGDGFPTGPMKGQVLSIYCYAVEPGYGHPAVYVWGIPQTTQNHKIGYDITGAPRSYELPFSKALEKECIQANKNGSQGAHEQIGPKSKKGKKKRGNGPHSTAIHFYKEPPALLTPKH